MIYRALPLSVLMLAGCTAGVNTTADANAAQTMNGRPTHATAVLSCTINGTAIGVSACLIGGGQATGGSLKVSSAGATKQYTDYDLARENGRTFELPLTAPFEVTAQANSEEGYVLRVEVWESGRAIFQDEATEFGVIAVDSASMGA